MSQVMREGCRISGALHPSRPGDKQRVRAQLQLWARGARPEWGRVARLLAWRL
jgi:hypothetical protein